jgi:hypothetical protein
MVKKLKENAKKELEDEEEDQDEEEEVVKNVQLLN